MQIIHGIHNIKKNFLNSVITIGNFGGIHLDHQKILSISFNISKVCNMLLIAILFELKTLEFFKFIPIPNCLTILYKKIKYLSSWNINYLLCIKFNNFFVLLHPEDFIINMLINILYTKFIVAGKDFQLGVQRSGNISSLKHIETKYTF